MIVRISVVGEELEAAVAIDAQVVRARRAIQDGVVGDGARGLRAGGGSVAIDSGIDHRILRSGETRLNVRACFAQMEGVCTNIAGLMHPVFAESALHGQVPLLGVRRYEFPRLGQPKEES